MDVSTYEIIEIAGYDLKGAIAAVWLWALVTAVALIFGTTIAILEREFTIFASSLGFAVIASGVTWIPILLVSIYHDDRQETYALEQIGLSQVEESGGQFTGMDIETNQFVRGAFVHLDGDTWVAVRFDPADVKQYGKYE